MNIAKADIYAIRPCYGKDNDGTWNQAKAEKWLSKIWPPGRESVTVQELADCDHVPVADRLWALIHLAPARTQRLFACAIAERALLALPETDRDPRSLAAIEVARRHADGRVSDRELAAARSAAQAAARSAADAAAAARAAAQRLFDCEIAERALLALPETDRDPRSLAAIKVARRHADGRVSDRELAAARSAAWAAEDATAAAWAAAWSAAWAAEDAAAWSAAWAAEDAAADAAAWAAARDEAAWAAADAAADAAQLTLLASMLTE
jgi:hypothetical protein